ncbi:MAG TPA: carboxypeptidase-like regulatory domain-containing protein, partial [Planctomycetota bacterium]|nr:carboxypeptidase-like regulatory domain-containing protein [Planctomycetota bacterium]
MRSRGVAVLLLLAAALAAAWVLHRESRDPPVDTVDVADPTPKEQGPAPSLAAPGARPTQDATGPGGRLVGTVRRAGRPVAARVEIRWRASLESFAQGHTVERTVADDLRPVRRNGPDAVGSAGSDGRYEIDVPTGNLDVTAIADDDARGRARAMLPTVGQQVTVDVDVGPACTLDGRARYADGRPFRGIVVVRPPDTYGPVLEEEAVATGEDGRFHVAGLLEGPQHTRFIVPGEALYFVSGPVLPKSESWDVVVDEDATTLEGRVVDADGDVPIEGATVVVLSDRVTTRVRSGVDGAFRATRRAAPTGYWLVASADGFAPRSVDGNPASPVTVRLVKAASLAGTVRRATEGSPVPGARVRVVVADGERLANPLAEATTDAEGRYAIEGLVPGVVAVFASAPGLSMALSPQDWKSGWSTTAVVLAP